MEAMSYSLPVVATDVGDNQFLVRNNENGFLCPVGVVEKIAECMKILVENSEQRICMGNKSYDYIQKNMSLDKFGSEFKRLIEEE
jgi:glycosyltransferase involved in cell wall biosynthesis